MHALDALRHTVPGFETHSYKLDDCSRWCWIGMVLDWYGFDMFWLICFSRLKVNSLGLNVSTLAYQALNQDSEECEAPKLCNDSRHARLPQNHRQVQPDRCLERTFIYTTMKEKCHDPLADQFFQSSEIDNFTADFKMFGHLTFATGHEVRTFATKRALKTQLVFSLNSLMAPYLIEGQGVCIDLRHTIDIDPLIFAGRNLHFDHQLWLSISGYNILILPTTGRFFQAALHFVRLVPPFMGLWATWWPATIYEQEKDMDKVEQVILKCLLNMAQSVPLTGAIRLPAAKQRRRQLAGGRPCHLAQGDSSKRIPTWRYWEWLRDD